MKRAERKKRRIIEEDKVKNLCQSSAIKPAIRQNSLYLLSLSDQ